MQVYYTIIDHAAAVEVKEAGVWGGEEEEFDF
jgi:hypothetical protein